MVAYLAILATAFAGMAGVTWWTAVVCGCLLTLISIAEQQQLAARYESIGAAHVLSAAAFASLGNGLMAGGAAFLLGRVSWFVWGN